MPNRIPEVENPEVTPEEPIPEDKITVTDKVVGDKFVITTEVEVDKRKIEANIARIESKIVSAGSVYTQALAEENAKLSKFK